MTDDYSHLPPVMARVCRALDSLINDMEEVFASPENLEEALRLARMNRPAILPDTKPQNFVEAEAALAAARQYRGDGVREAAQRLVNNALVDDYGSIIPDEDDWVALENALTYTPEEPSHD